MKKDTESLRKGGLYILDSMSNEEFQNVLNLFSLLLLLDEKARNTQVDLNSEKVPLGKLLK